MGNVAGLLGQITGVGQQNLGNLENAGYAQYVPGAAPQLNMGAYAPTTANLATAAQIGPGANAELGNQQSLISQLQAQAQGTGPDLAAQELKQGTQANLASQLAAAAGTRGNQNPGAAQAALANGAAAANQAEAGQAAQLRGTEQLNAENALGSTLGQVSGQQQQLAENQAGLTQAVNLQNAAAQNQAGEFSEEAEQQGNAAQQAQYQFGTNIAAQQQTNQNAAIAGQQLSAQNTLNNAAVGAVGGGLNAAGGAGASAVGSGTGNGGAAQGGSSEASLNASTDNELGGTNQDNSQPEAMGGINQGSTHLVGEAGHPEAIVPVTHIHLHQDGGGIVNHPEVRKIGDGKHAMAVVPLHDDGSPATERMDDHVKELLMHPDFQKAVSTVVSHHADALKAAFESRRRK